MWTLLLAATWACDVPYTVDALLGDLSAVEEALRTGADAAPKASALEGGLACLDVVLPGILVGRSWRAVAAGHLEDGRAAPWLRTAAALDGSFIYGVDEMADRHPLRLLWNAERETVGAAPVTAEGTLVAGQHMLDGRKLEGPRARPAAMHLYQWVGPHGVRSAVIEGATFPTWALVPVVVEAPAREKPGRVPKAAAPAREDGPVVLSRKRPWEKTPLVVGGAAVVGGSGLLYWISSTSRARFDDATTLDEATAARNTTNALVLGAVGALAVGAGTLTWGVVLADLPGPVLGVRF